MLKTLLTENVTGLIYMLGSFYSRINMAPDYEDLCNKRNMSRLLLCMKLSLLLQQPQQTNKKKRKEKRNTSHRSLNMDHGWMDDLRF